MKLKTLLLSLFVYGSAQAQSSYFNSIGPRKEKAPVADTVVITDTEKTKKNLPSSVLPNAHEAEEPSALQSFLSSLSIKELEDVISKYIGNHTDSQQTKVVHTKKRKQSIPPRIHLYEGESHPLTALNVLKVMEEVGVSHQIFVLAQSILETGNYKSNVCRNYNNLFGLVNPRTGRYYAFTRWEDSVVGYKNYVQYKYKGGNYLSFLKRIGYADDPRYISKVAKISLDIKKYTKITD